MADHRTIATVLKNCQVGKEKKKLRIAVVRRPWTPEEDELLRAAVNSHEKKRGRWKHIAQMVNKMNVGNTPRGAVQCNEHWKKVLDPALVKGSWTEEENRLLLMLKQEKPELTWAEISERCGRSAKQCRERWDNSANPEVRKGKFSVEEDKVLVEKWKKLGTRWSQIMPFLPGMLMRRVGLCALVYTPIVFPVIVGLFLVIVLPYIAYFL